MLSYNYNLKTFNQKLNLYKKLIDLDFRKKIELLDNKPKYILMNLFPKYESFRNQTARDEMKKFVIEFVINLKKIKNMEKIEDNELYVMLLIKFINKNMKNYNIYGNRKNI